MPAAFYTRQPGPEALQRLNEMYAAFLAGAVGGGGGTGVDLTALNAAVAAAEQSAALAGTRATAAGTSATAANNSAVSAGNAATNSGNSATAAAGSATTAGNASSAVATSATNAAGSATAAAGSATASGNSATASAASATASGNSATASANSATNAGTSAQSAADSAAAAAVSAGTTPPPSASAPLAPTNFVASGATGTTMNLSWSASGTATGYNIYQAGVKISGPTPIAALAYTATGLAASTPYTWTVKAVNANGEGAGSNASQSTIGLSLPAAPLNLAQTAQTANSITLGWGAVTGATGYNVYMNGVKNNAAPVAGNSGYIVTGLTAATPYPFTVKAVNSAGEGPASAALNASTTGAAINGLTPLFTRGLAGYFEAYRPTYSILAASQKYGLLYLFNAQPRGATDIERNAAGNRDNLGDGTFKLFNQGEAQISNDKIQAVRARGQKVVLTFGGAGANYNFDTRAKSNAFVASVKVEIAKLQIPANGTAPGADGIDLNFFEAFVRDLSKSNPAATVNFVTEVTYIVQTLRDFYGANFIITMPPTPDTFRTPNFAPLDGQLAKALSDRGLLTCASPQYYEYVGTKDVNFIKNYHGQWVNHLSNRQQQVGVGLSNHRTYDSPTVAEGMRELTAILGLFPNTRMAYCWNVQADMDAGNTWVDAAYTTMGVGGSSPPAETPVVVPVDESAVTNALTFEGGKNGAWLDLAPANLRQGPLKTDPAVTASGQDFRRIVDRSVNDNDAVFVTGPTGGVSNYTSVAGKHLGQFFAAFISQSGGGSGQGGTTWGFAASMIVEPQGYYHTAWTDQTTSFNGRFLKYDPDLNGFVFSVGTGVDRKQVVVGDLGTLYQAPPAGTKFQVDVRHEGLTLYMRVNRGVMFSAPCPAFALGSTEYAISGKIAVPGEEAAGRINYSVHTISSLTEPLCENLSLFVSTKK